ncbi:MAG: hypothetical protein K1X72_09285 [Pyrinomonadaceae bacterium]|nr:hypothetical protein [Pyrinomonadaceae bacterium]
MLYLQRTLSIVFLTFAFCFFAHAQDTKNSDILSLKDLKLNSSTVDEVIAKFGKPIKDKDKISLKSELELQNWLIEKSSAKVFRVIEYKNLQDYEKVRFAFVDDKLAVIILELPSAITENFYIAPDELEELFSLKFKPWKWTFGKKLPQLIDFQQSSPNELKKEDYSYWYNLIALAEDYFIATRINNYKNIEGIIDRHKTENNRRKQINANRKFPGFVENIQIISRTLESKN